MGEWVTIVTWLNRVLIYFIQHVNPEQDMYVYSTSIWKRTYCRPQIKEQNGKYIGGVIWDDLRHVYNIR